MKKARVPDKIQEKPWRTLQKAMMEYENHGSQIVCS
jgi:hypothetical protein